MKTVNSDDDWDLPTAFDDLDHTSITEPKKGCQWGSYAPTTSSIYHGKGYCAFRLILVNVETGEEVELWFNNVTKGKNNDYSVKRSSKFAKLYIECFGRVNTRRFSKAQQLLKHFHKKGCVLNCMTEYARHESGMVYTKVIEQKNGNKKETSGKHNRNLVETNWKPQLSETPMNKRPIRQSKVIINNPIVNGVINQYDTPAETLMDDMKYQVENNLNGINFIQKPNETREQLYERAISETF